MHGNFTAIHMKMIMKFLTYLYDDSSSTETDQAFMSYGLREKSVIDTSF